MRAGCLCVVAAAMCLLGCQWDVARPSIAIKPIASAPAGQNQYIGFNLCAEGMAGFVRVRFPENVNSSQGVHFLDNVQPEVKRVSEVRVPDWQTDPRTGGLSYVVQTAEGIDFSGSAVVVGSAVEMTFAVTNRTDRPRDITAQVCVDLSPCEAFNMTQTAADIFAVYQGQPISFGQLTGEAAAEKQAATGYPWILMLTGNGPHQYLYQLQQECPWWIADQRADLPLIWRQSQDGQHLIAVAWGEDTVHRLMTNTSIPCLHADPLEVKQLEAGKKAVWKGRIFLMKNDPKELLDCFQVRQ